jgi:hypothetical protein
VPLKIQNAQYKEVWHEKKALKKAELVRTFEFDLKLSDGQHYAASVGKHSVSS